MTTTAVLETNPHGGRLRVMTISRATDLWLGELERRNHAERTIQTYRRLLDRLADDYPAVDVDELTPEQIRRFLDRQARRRDGTRKSASTIGQNVSTICGFFDWLTREGVITRNPIRRNGDRIISRPRQLPPEENDNVTTISTRDVYKLLETSRRMRWNRQIAVHALVMLGPRRRALSRVRISDYDPSDRTIRFAEKGGKTITKPIPDQLADMLDQAIKRGEYKSFDDYLVPSDAEQRRPGERDARVIWRLVRDVAQEAGVTTHVHALRAAFATYFLEQKPGELVALKDLMGHKRIETTLVYLRRLNRRRSMETVRDLSWIPANSEELLDANRGAEKEGFEPSFKASPHGSGAGTHTGDGAPRTDG